MNIEVPGICIKCAAGSTHGTLDCPGHIHQTNQLLIIFTRWQERWDRMFREINGGKRWGEA